MAILLIKEVLNNNVLLVENGRQKEIIWGRGIGFKAHKDQNYDLHAGDRVFSQVPANDTKWIAQFKKLSSEIPRKYFDLTEKIIRLAQKEIDSGFDEHLLIPLTDHIYFAVERYHMGLDLTNPMLYDLKHFFKKEYKIGLKAQKMIQDLSGVPISEDEAGFIAIHLVEHEIKRQKSPISNFNEFIQVSNHVKRIIESIFGKRLSEDDYRVGRLMDHLKTLVLQPRSVPKSNPSDSELLSSLKNGHRKAAVCLTLIVNYLQEKLSIEFTDSEKLYLLIHIIHITE